LEITTGLDRLQRTGDHLGSFGRARKFWQQGSLASHLGEKELAGYLRSCRGSCCECLRAAEGSVAGSTGGGRCEQLAIGVDVNERGSDVVQPAQRVEGDVAGVSDQDQPPEL
jgi:hypothetical protein